jgi:two-component system CheB/CheR fusion protein
MLGLTPGDVGRPIPRLKLKVDVRNLEDAMLDVIQRVQPRHDQVQDEAGHWFTLRLTPYRTLDNRIDGVVLSVVDGNLADEAGNGGPLNNGGRGSRKRAEAKKQAVRPMKKR